MSKKFMARVMAQMPEFANKKGYIYKKNVTHIMAGFLCERPPNRAYFWKYALPLYDNIDFLHLGFGERLPGPDGFLITNSLSETELADEFLIRIRPYLEEIELRSNLLNFLYYVEKLGLENPWLRRAYAMTLIMLERGDEALTQIDILIRAYDTRNLPHFDQDISIIRADLLNGVEFARDRLLEWESSTKLRLGI